jgi:2-amino-4-hydroxy-6-hydroxymethyldihydropteridine diphosphokinase
MILIALGANLPSRAGTPAETIHASRVELADAGVRVHALSPLYETPAWPDPTDPSFVNAVARVETTLAPAALLAALQNVEALFGRTRGARNAPRSLDLDIIDLDGRVESGPPQLPHPRLASRGFVLIPLRDVAPHWRHPVSGLAIDALIAALPDEARAVKPII